MLTMFRCKLCRTVLDLLNNKLNKRLYHFTDDFYGYKSKLPSKYHPNDDVLAVRRNSINLYQLVEAYRKYGHKQANINPVVVENESFVPELNPQRYGLNESDIYKLRGLIETDKNEASLGEIIDILRNIYCSNLGVEFSHLENEEEKDWFYSRFERLSQEGIDVNIERAIAKELLKSQAFEKFLATKFVSLKRYGGEGAESMMAFFYEVLKVLSEVGVKEAVIGMPHRGRLSLLTGMLKLPPIKLFHKLAGNSEFPSTANATGDVISHFTTSVDLEFNENKIHVTSLYNPSHLEAVNPVSMGKARCKHQIYKQGGYGDKRWGEDIVNIQVHGDGAIMGQGINQETVLMSLLPFYQVGGSIHFIVNNQVAFTTPPHCGRGTQYASDIAKIISAPVIHVNGDSPKDVVKAARLAVEYQRRFRKDVFVDMNCYRYWGHNELDDPTFTNPAIYKVIRNRKSVPEMYSEKLVNENKMTKEETELIVTEHSKWLNDQLKEVDSYQPQQDYLKGEWNGYVQAPNAITTWDTGVQTDLLHYIGRKSVTLPDDFNVHPNLLKSHIQARQKRLNEGLSLDWSTCEALAFGSLLYQGYNVRISGQDVGRGTFSHRHAMIIDQISNKAYTPLNNLSDSQDSKLEIANSLLSEEAVLGFEYGMSIGSPKNLIIWEAQFGDFFNGAQIQIDAFITSGECKWMQCSGLVMLLPHGYDGAGPEHSSCRIERFLQLTDSNEVRPDGEDVNIHIVNPTTPAQYFHLLRRQMIRDYRKPLIVITPKTLLRLPEATSPLTAMQPGTSFHTVLDDNWLAPNENVTKIILTSGKHYYALSKFREESMIKDTAIIRVEELCPFPLLNLQNILKKYNRARVFIWSQEEPQNMGAWSYIKPRFENLLGKRIKYCGRKPLPAPAVGIGKIHKEEAEYVIKQPFQLK